MTNPEVKGEKCTWTRAELVALIESTGVYIGRPLGARGMIVNEGSLTDYVLRVPAAEKTSEASAATLGLVQPSNVGPMNAPPDEATKIALAAFGVATILDLEQIARPIREYGRRERERALREAIAICDGYYEEDASETADELAERIRRALLEGGG